MEVAAAGINLNGGNIQQSTWRNGNNQKFNLELIRKILNITESKFDSDITIYPIPTKDSFTLSGLNSGEKRQIKIINMLDKTLKYIEINQDNFIVDTSNIQSGIYTQSLFLLRETKQL